MVLTISPRESSGAALINLQRLRDQTNLRQQFGLAACALCLLIVASVATGAAIVGERAVRAASEKEMGQIAHAVADRLNRGFASRLHTLELLAEMRPIKETIVGDDKAATALFEQAERAIPNTAWMAYVTLDGRIQSASDGKLKGLDVSAESWFQNRLAGSKLTDAHRFEPLEQWVPNAPGITTPPRFLGLTVRVEDAKGRMFGVLAALIDSREWVFDSISVTLARRDETSTTSIWIFDRAGQPIFAPEGDMRGTGVLAAARAQELQRGSFTDDSLGDSTTVGFARTYGDLGYGWMVVSARSQPKALGMLQSMVAAIIIIGAVVGLIGLIGAVVLARQLSTPIRQLADMADQLGHDQKAMIPWLRGSSEVVRLSSALRALVVRLGFSEREREIVESRAVNDAKKFSSDIAMLRTLADTDGLTRLLNRRAFMSFATDAFEHYQRYHRPFAVLMLDLDHFKAINDSYGHAAGDTVLGVMAARIADTLRPTDKVGRFGGEEFIVLLREVAIEDARDAAERIRQAVADEPVPFDDAVIPVTVSIGLAAVATSDRDIQDVIGRGDLALYEAKNSGRNRVAVAGERNPMRKAG
jgi:diguanylate cyclase (GGDEF)-like protein